MIHPDRYEMITSMSQVRLIDLYLSEVTSYITCSKKKMRVICRLRRHLTDITTVSSLNFGMYLSPLVISDSLSGLNRHITFTQHSAASTMMVWYDFIQGNVLSGQQIWSSTPQSAEECINQTIKISRRLPAVQPVRSKKL